MMMMMMMRQVRAWVKYVDEDASKLGLALFDPSFGVWPTSSSSLLLAGLELSDTTIYKP